MNSKLNRRGYKIVGAVVLILAALLFAQAVNGYLFAPKAVVHLADSRFEVNVADNDNTRIKGLSGTSELPPDRAMLFVFDYDSRWAIWMKDMNYPIDIVWLDKEREVVDLVTGATPDSYPDTKFIPKAEARYVLEFKSGTVEEKGISVGQKAVFSGVERES